MKRVTDNFLAKMEDTLRTYIPRLSIDGVEIDGDLQAGMTINLGSCGSEAFSIGTMFIPSISASISECTTKLQDKELLLEMGLIMDNGEVEYLPVGYFTVEKPYTKKDVTTFTAYGRLMSKGGILYSSSLTYPTTLQSVIDEIAETMGISIVLNGLTADGTIDTPIKGELCRDALKYVAGLLGGFVTEDSAGNGVISNYSLNQAVTMDTDLCYEFPESNDDVYTVTGIEVIVKEEGSEEDGTTVEGEKYASDTDINVVTLNPYMNQSLFESCEANIVGYSYLPSTVRFLGDIRLEPWDSIVVMDDEEAIDVPCMNISHVWDGGLMTTITAPGQTSVENGSNYQGPMSSMVEKVYLKTLVLEQLIAQKIDAEYIRTNYLEATDLHISGNSTFGGTLTAEAGGVIGGFTIGDNALHNGASFSSLTATGSGVYLGTDGIKLGNNFLVKSDGVMSAKNAKLQELNVFNKIAFLSAIDIMPTGGSTAYASVGDISIGDMEDYVWKDGMQAMGSGCLVHNAPTRFDHLLSAESLYVDTTITTGDNIYLGANAEGIFTGGKTTYGEGKEGVHIRKNGRIYMEGGSVTPGLYFYHGGQTSNGANIVYDSTDDYLKFNGAAHYEFSSGIYGTALYLTGSIIIGTDDISSDMTARGLSITWKDNTTHYIVYRSNDGLTAYFGWAGSSSYASVGILRGHTVKYSNSSGTTTLSDERLKKDFTSLDEWDSFFDAIEPCAFRMKGGASGRFHMGFKAQQVEQALLDCGLSTKDFAGFIRMPYQPDSDDPEGNAIYEAAGIMPGDDELGLVYTEFTAMNTYQIQKLKKEISELKSEIKALKNIS